MIDWEHRAFEENERQIEMATKEVLSDRSKLIVAIEDLDSCGLSQQFYSDLATLTQSEKAFADGHIPMHMGAAIFRIAREIKAHARYLAEHEHKEITAEEMENDHLLYKADLLKDDRP